MRLLEKIVVIIQAEPVQTEHPEELVGDVRASVGDPNRRRADIHHLHTVVDQLPDGFAQVMRQTRGPRQDQPRIRPRSPKLKTPSSTFARSRLH